MLNKDKFGEKNGGSVKLFSDDGADARNRGMKYERQIWKERLAGKGRKDSIYVLFSITNPQ